MSRLLQRPIQMIELNQYGEPLVFLDGDLTHTVIHLIDSWMESGNWIDGEPHRMVYTVCTDRNAVYDIQCAAQQWSIYRVYD